MPRSARDLMRSEPLTVAAETPLLDVQHVLVLAQVSGMPVVDESGRVIGMLSASDVLRALEQAFDGDVGDGELEQRFATVAALTARDLATPDAIWIAADTPASEIAERMLRDGVHSALVGDGERLEGILTAFDLLAAVS